MSVNPTSTTWKFTIRTSETSPPNDVMELPKSLINSSRVQLAHWHLERWGQQQPFVRGILRCTRPTSLKIAESLLPQANFKPFRGVFTLDRINSVLKSTNRIGEVFSIGSIISNKRSRHDTCPHCGSYKRARTSPSPSPLSSEPEAESDTDTQPSEIITFFNKDKITI